MGSLLEFWPNCYSPGHSKILVLVKRSTNGGYAMAILIGGSAQCSLGAYCAATTACSAMRTLRSVHKKKSMRSNCLKNLNLFIC